ncbi:MAG: FtsX-like permease family protein [Treponemataceae bacterium]
MMKGRVVFFISLRYLLGRGKEGGRYLRGAAFGIAISLVPIIVTLVVADGMIRGITERYLELGSYHIQASDRRVGGEPATELSAVVACPGVRGAWPERQGLGILVGSSGKSGANIRAVTSDFLRDRGTARFLKAVSGTADFSSDKDALLGEELARKIGAGVGDTVRLMTARTTLEGRTIPRVSAFTVRGIVSSGYRELDALWLFVPYEAGKKALSPEASRAFIGIKLDDPYKGVETVSAALNGVLPRGFATYTWYELQRSQYQSYESTRQLLLFIMALVVVVAAVNVASATSMLAVERRRDIAILKGYGADPRDTTRIFLFCSFLTGALGSFLGLAAGLLAALNVNALIHGVEFLLGILARTGSFFSGSAAGAAPRLLDPAYYLETIPVSVDWNALLLIAVGTTVCSVLAAWAPAHRAGKTRPLEILRKF